MTIDNRAMTPGVVCLLLLALAAGPARAQDTASPPAAPVAAPASALLRVFVDCNRCDTEYLRQNVGFVDYVRDRAVSDVHVLVTTEETGGGGLSWVVRFIGLGPFQGQERSLTFTTVQTATDDDRRKEFARIFKIGLVAYVGNTAVVADLDVTWKKPDAAKAAQRDPWNYWVFRVGANGFANGERSSQSLSTFGSFSANRTTDNWKILTSASGNFRKNTFEVEAETITSENSGWNMNALVVKSLGAQWGAGLTTGLSHSSFSNTDKGFNLSPGIEYNFFPYKESSRRSLTIHYSAGLVHNEYAELTIYDKLSEALPRHQVRASLSLRQPWGSLSVSSQFSQQLNRLERYRESISGDADIRLFKGFSFNIFAQYENIADQISLRKDVASENEVLLGVQQLQTNYSYFMGFGVSYSFGSIFNSVVNSRFNFF